MNNHEELKHLLYQTTSQLVQSQQREEKADFLWEFSDYIDDWHNSIIELQAKKTDPKRLEKLQKHEDFMIKVFNTYGRFFFDEIAHRRKCFLLEKELLETRFKLAEAAAELVKLKEMNKF